MEKKNKEIKKKEKDRDVKSGCGYYVDPCGCYRMDPCGCCYVDPCCCC